MIHRKDMLCDSFLKCVYIFIFSLVCPAEIYPEWRLKPLTTIKKTFTFIRVVSACVCQRTQLKVYRKWSVIKVYRNEIHIQTSKIKMLFCLIKTSIAKTRTWIHFYFAKLTFLLIKKKKKKGRQNRRAKEKHKRRKKTNPNLNNRLPLVKTVINHPVIGFHVVPAFSSINATLKH